MDWESANVNSVRSDEARLTHPLAELCHFVLEYIELSKFSRGTLDPKRGGAVHTTHSRLTPVLVHVLLSICQLQLTRVEENSRKTQVIVLQDWTFIDVCRRYEKQIRRHGKTSKGMVEKDISTMA